MTFSTGVGLAVGLLHFRFVFGIKNPPPPQVPSGRAVPAALRTGQLSRGRAAGPGHLPRPPLSSGTLHLDLAPSAGGQHCQKRLSWLRGGIIRTLKRRVAGETYVRVHYREEKNVFSQNILSLNVKS